MSNSITRCPKCITCFRISEAHLKLAKGSVRCGSCLHVFNASKHIVKKEAAKPQIKKPVEQPKTKSQENEDILISDDMVIADTQEANSNADKFNADFHDNILYSRDLGKQESNLFERDFLGDKDEESTQTDESWALDLLENADSNLSEKPRQREEAKQDSEEFEFERSFNAHHEQGAESEFENHPPTGSAFQIIEDDEPNEEELRQTLFGSQMHGEDDLTTYSEVREIEYPGNPGERITPSNNVYLDFEPEPVEMSWRGNYPIWKSNWLWAPLSVAAGIFLLIQIAWIQFNDWSRIEPYRNYYKTVCQTLGCELPKLIDHDKIKAANLVVRSHPTTPGALIVDTVIQNTAKFEQRFPSIDLVFTDLSNKTIAARRFEPAEYLGGELAGRKQMPIKQPVHIALEIVDPGEKAVSYRISIAN